MNIIKKNKVSGIKSWFASPREKKDKDLVYVPVIFWYWPMQGDLKKKTERKENLSVQKHILKNH